MDERKSVEWTPLTPPSRGKRLLYALQRHSFLLVCLVLFLGLTAFLLFYPAPPSDEIDAAELEELIRQHQQARPVDVRSTSVVIASEPSGATVLWDMDSVGITPLRLASVETGGYVLRLSHEGHAPLDTFVIVPEESTELSMRLVLRPEPSAEESMPASTDAPPAVASPDPAPTQSQERTRRARVAASESDRSPTGLLTVTSDPSGASVLIDGDLYGRTPHTLPAVPAGAHEITLHLDGYRRRTVPAEVIATETNYVHEQLEQRTGTLAITVKPWGTIYIDDVLHELDTDVRYQTTLPVGYHTVRAEHPTLGTHEQAVLVRDDETTHVVLRMSETADEAAQHKQDGPQENYQ